MGEGRTAHDCNEKPRGRGIPYVCVLVNVGFRKFCVCSGDGCALQSCYFVLRRDREAACKLAERPLDGYLLVPANILRRGRAGVRAHTLSGRCGSARVRNAAPSRSLNAAPGGNATAICIVFLVVGFWF